MAMLQSAASSRGEKSAIGCEADDLEGLGERRREGKTVNDEDAVADPKVPIYYVEAQNLLWIKKDPVWKTVLKESARKESFLISRIERKRTTRGTLSSEVFQLLGIYCIFQGLLLVAVSSSTLLRCDNIVFPVIFSVSASIIFVVGVASKLLHVRQLEETIWSETQALKEVRFVGLELRRLGKNFKLPDTSAAHQAKPGSAAVGCRPYPRSQKIAQMLVGVGVMVIFQLVWVFPLSHRRILC